MANVFSTNYAIPSSTNVLSVLWQLTRVMKAAGWTYRASANSLTKDTTGIAANDLWGTNATPTNDTYSSVQTTIASASNTALLPQGTITVASTTGFAGSGNISIATSNGWQTVAYTGTTATTFTTCTGGAGTMYTGAAVVQGSSTVGFDGVGAWWTAAGPVTVKIPLNANPTGTPIRGEIITQATSGATGELIGYVWDPVGSSGWASVLPQATQQSTTIASGSNGVALTTGTINVASTTGFASIGNILVWSSPVATTIAAGSNGASLPQGTINVASTTGFPTSGIIYVTTASGTQTVYYTGTSGGNSFTGCVNGAGAMATGGNVSGAQSPVQIAYTGTSGGNSFTGCTGGSGTMTTGNAVTGLSACFDGSHTITGGISGATMVPTGTVVYYQRELSFGKLTTSLLNGNIYYIVADCALEANMLYSTLASSVGCTSTVWPGGGGTNNTFTNVSAVSSTNLNLCLRGTGNSTAGSDTWFSGGGVTYATAGHAQMACANAIHSAGVSADGSFYTALSSSTANIMTGFVFSRVDDCEPGDLDPYVYMGQNNTSAVNWVRTSATSQTGGNLSNYNAAVLFDNVFCWAGYQARGCTVFVRDVCCGYYGCLEYNQAVGGTVVSETSGTIRLVSNPATTTPIVRESPLIYTSGVTTTVATLKQFKGRPRWLQVTSVGNALDTFDSKTWVCVLNYAVGNSTPSVLLGPYDGTTVPLT